MAYDIFVNTDREIVRSVVKSRTQPQAPVSVPDFVLGDSGRDINLYFIDANGDYQSWSGSAAYSIKFGVGDPGAAPSGGTFTLGDGSDTTSAISYGASAATVQAALNALNTDSGPGSDTVTVTKVSDNLYLVEWDSDGAQSNLQTNSDNLDPQSAVVVSEVTAGDGSTREKQAVRLVKQPIILQSTWSTISNGFNARVSANNVRVLRFLAGASSKQTTLEIEVTDGSSNRTTYAQVPVNVRNESVDEESFDPDVLPVPLYASTGIRTRYDIEALTGGASNALDSVATVDLAVNTTFACNVTPGASVPGKIWRLDSGTDAEDAPNGIVRPDDYASSTNEKVWKVYI